MSYYKRLTIPKNTNPDDPVSVEIPIQPMIIDRVEITFPSRCVGLVGVRFLYQSRVLFPYNPDEWYRGDGQTVVFSPNLELKERPLFITIEGYNDDDTFQHNIYVVIDVEFKGGIFWDVWKAFIGGPSAGPRVIPVSDDLGGSNE
ncbi:hypothetical protein LCGC14_2126180 [marine sediment metagenome]|uniref:Uncharacterized protein n=1 Tax=marine sediment metagenome TaxID=412755 RepID=A0A0F9E2R8_9ZZZZ